MVQFRIGHSGITWGYTKDEAEQAVKDVAELGYRAYETFGFVLEQYKQERGGFGAVLDRYRIPLAGAYCPTRFYDPSDADQDIKQVIKWAKLAQSLGATTIVLQAGKRQDKPYHKYLEMAEVFNEIGRQVRDLGLNTTIHPHTGTLIETRAEIDAVLNAVDPELVGFAPDTGQIAKGGSDPIETLRAHKHLLNHIHLKDYGGGKPTGYAGYVPVGSGVIDMPSIFEILDEVNFDGWIIVELDGTPEAPRPPREAAAMSKRYLEQLLGDRADW